MRNLKEDLLKVRDFEKKLFANAGTLATYAMRGSLQGDLSDIPSSLSQGEKDQLLRYRELNALAGKCGLNEFSDTELQELDNIEMAEIVDGVISGLKDIKE